MSKLTILQIGNQDWSKQHSIPESLEWEYLHPTDLPEYLSLLHELQDAKEAVDAEIRMILDEMAEAEEESPLPDVQKRLKKLQEMDLEEPIRFTALVLSEQTYPPELEEVVERFDVYEIFYPAQFVEPDEVTASILKKKMGQPYDISDKDAFIYSLTKSLFSGQVGAKLGIDDLEVSPTFHGNVHFLGRQYAQFSGDFGSEFSQLAYYRFNRPISTMSFTDLFLDYRIEEGDCELQVCVSLIPKGATDYISKEWIFEGEELKGQLTLDTDFEGYYFISIRAKGTGMLKIGPCHYRWSRNGFGEFILGGKRLVDQHHQEIHTYFNPGDFKPPFCVYFSGFRTAEGFEGYWMMRGFGTPFMLICDPRLDGGSFYIGSQDLEHQILNQIKEHLDYLGFESNQMILSGMSMGTYGATYYGAQLRPYGIVLSKPIMNLGLVATREKRHRPGGFPTSLDIVRSCYGRLDLEAAEQLDQRFWSVMQKDCLKDTIVSIAYMKEDDYDPLAFEHFVHWSKQTGAIVRGRGYSGRHLDGGSAPVNWFVKQYHSLIEKGFRGGSE